jgi:two-component system NtrC family sensor kinase
VKTDKGSALIWTFRDVSARTEIERQKKSLEKELEQAHRLESLGTLAGGIAHELNTPIQFVSDNMRFLGDAFAEVQRALAQYALITAPSENERIVKENDLAFLLEEAPNAVKQSLEGLERAADIVLAVKRFSHPSGDIKEDNDLNQIISTTATVSKNQWKYIADLDLDLDQNLPLVKSNAGELNQVLINLIVNAAHAIEDRNDKDHKGKISISTRMVGNAIACSVSDSGVGIPARDRDKIFDLFFTTKAPGRGTGQGLALVHKIITSHGGRITVNSEIGKGTRFIFILPIDASASKIAGRDIGGLRTGAAEIT